MSRTLLGLGQKESRGLARCHPSDSLKEDAMSCVEFKEIEFKEILDQQEEPSSHLKPLIVSSTQEPEGDDGSLRTAQIFGRQLARGAMPA